MLWIRRIARGLLFVVALASLFHLASDGINGRTPLDPAFRGCLWVCFAVAVAGLSVARD